MGSCLPRWIKTIKLALRQKLDTGQYRTRASSMRLTADVIERSAAFTNALGERELDLRSTNNFIDGSFEIL